MNLSVGNIIIYNGKNGHSGTPFGSNLDTSELNNGDRCEIIEYIELDMTTAFISLKILNDGNMINLNILDIYNNFTTINLFREIKIKKILKNV